MASDANQGNYGEFSVIIRPRPGVPCSLSTQGIIMQIAEHLASYNCVCDIALNSRNFVVRLPTVEFQLQILSCKAFVGTTYVLDILPWSYEYESLNLPWIFVSAADCIGIHKAVQNNSENILSADLQSAGHDINAQTHHRHVTSSAQVNLLDDLKNIWVSIPQAEQSSETTKDFSYLMVNELRGFYHAKITAFGACKQMCKEMHSIAFQFYRQVENTIEKINKETSKYHDIAPENALYNVAQFGDHLYNKLWFLSEEIFGFQFAAKPIFEQESEPIDLKSFPAHQTQNQVETPFVAASLLKIITETMTHQIYGCEPLIATKENLVGSFDTQIWCSAFHHTYRTSNSALIDEAEASSIYRFLKYTTNVLGYIIGDPNSHVLLAIISHINSVNASVSELHLYTKQVVQMIKRMDEGIREMYNQITATISSEQILDIDYLVNDLLVLLEHYTAATAHGLHTFEQQKQTFSSIRLETGYPSNPEHL